MGAYRCIECEINYPRDVIPEEKRCFACGGEVGWRQKSHVDENWRELVAERVEYDHFSCIAPDVWVRAERLMRCGVDVATSLSWAEIRAQWGGYELDVHAFEKEYKALTAAGCSHELALQILKPVGLTDSPTSKAL